MKNILCQNLNIRYPILLGGLFQIGKAGLAAAVSEGGGLGILGAGAWTGEELRGQIGQLRKLTGKPFGVNIPVRSPRSPELVEVVLEEKVPVVTTSAHRPCSNAVGVQVGTRFLASEESEATPAYKEALLLAKDTDTLVVQGKRVAHRDLKDELLLKVTPKLDKLTGESWVSLHERERVQEEEIQSQLEERKTGPTRSSGQVAGLIHEIVPAREVLIRMVREAREALGALSDLFPA